MSTSKKIAFAMSISWVSRALSIVAALYLIPAMFRYLSREELGIWYLLGTSQAYVGLFGFGVAPVLTRHIAFLAKTSHLDAGAVIAASELEMLGRLLVTGRKLLRWMAVATFVVAWISGYLLIRTLPLHELSFGTVLWAWTLMCAGWSLGVWMSYLDCWAAGLGYVGWDTLITMSVTAGTMLANIAAVYLGGGLLTLAWIALVSVLVQRALLVMFLRRRKAEVFALVGAWCGETARKVMRPAMSVWVMMIGAFLLYKTDQYFIALFLGVGEVALYQSTYNTVFTMATVAVAYVLSSSVFVSQYWAAGDVGAVHLLLVRGCRIGLTITAAGAVFLLMAGREFFQLWLHGAFVGYPTLAVLVTTIVLDTNHTLLTCVSRATDDEKYAVPAIVAGLLNLALTWVLIQRLGLLGAPLGTLIAQLLTNNWYGIYRPLVRLAFSFREYLTAVILPVGIFTLCAVMLTIVFMRAGASLFGAGNFVLCASALAACGMAGGAGLYLIFRFPWKYKGDCIGAPAAPQDSVDVASPTF